MPKIHQFLPMRRLWQTFPLQLFLFTILPLSLLVIGIALRGAWLHQQAIRQLVGERDERAARAVAIAIEEQLRHRVEAIEILAQRATVTDFGALLQANSDLYLPDFDQGIAFVDVNGKILASTNEPILWQSRLAFVEEMPAFQWANDETLLVIGRVENGVMAVGAFSADATIAHAFDGIFLAQDQVDAFVVTDEGRLLYQRGRLHQHAELQNQPIPNNSQTRYLEIDGVEHVVATARIPSVNWVLTIEEPWQAVQVPLLNTTSFTPFLLLPLLLATLGVLWFGMRRIVQPLRALEVRAGQVAGGNYAGIQQPIGGINEIQQLQQTFIYMTQRVQAAQMGLRRYLEAVTLGQEEERRRLARELHDETLQSLVALDQRVQLAQITPSSERLAEMRLMLADTMGGLRRLTQDLHPVLLADLGLMPALTRLCDNAQNPPQLIIQTTTSGTPQRLPDHIELALYRIAQEALNNVVRHAHASRVMVQLHYTLAQVTLEIRDNGQGFLVDQVPTANHFGLVSIRERADLIGASYDISSEIGDGTLVSVRVAYTPFGGGKNG